MAAYEYSKRFQESTRGRVVELLRIRNRTVEELAQELGLTDNAVRTHLATLERDGIVRQEGVRRGSGAGKPAWVFGIVPEAETRFSRAYLPLLLAIIEELSARGSDAELETLMRSAGRRLAASSTAAEHADRVGLAAAVLQELGALTEVTRHNGSVVIHGHGCPVGMAVSAHPSVCRAVQALIESIVGEPVHEQCDRSGRPSCRFQFPVSAQSR